VLLKNDLKETWVENETLCYSGQRGYLVFIFAWGKQYSMLKDGTQHFCYYIWLILIVSFDIIVVRQFVKDTETSPHLVILLFSFFIMLLFQVHS